MHGLVFPLITTAAGAKFGKTEAGNVWLDPARTSPYQFYQFWVNTDDRDVERYLKLFTFLRLDRIEATLAEHAARPRKAGRPEAARARSHLDGARRGGGGASEGDRGRMFGGRRHRRGPGAELPERRRVARPAPGEIPIVDLLVASGLASSKADARRGIQGRGFYLNGQAIDAVDLTLGEDRSPGTVRPLGS